MLVEQQQVDNRNAHSEYNETDQVCEPHAVGICVDGRAIEEVRYTKDSGPECGWADSQGLARGSDDLDGEQSLAHTSTGKENAVHCTKIEQRDGEPHRSAP